MKRQKNQNSKHDTKKKSQKNDTTKLQDLLQSYSNQHSVTLLVKERIHGSVQ